MLTVKVVGTAYEVDYGRLSIRVQSKLRAAEIAYDAILAGGIQFPEDENDFVVNGKIVRSMSEDDVRSEGILIIPKKKV